MNRNTLSKHSLINCEHGFSLAEIIVVIAIAAILMAVSLPPYFEWRKNANFRMSANKITQLMREARSNAISKGQQQTVVFKPATKSYPVSVPTEATIRSSADGISTDDLTVTFNPNGTATITGPDGNISGNISVNDGAAQKYLVSVLQTGKVSSKKKY
jgi:prepilin-type N-terminal cleavage/methylation domain-containing protein